MTITYSLEISTATFCGMLKLLNRWKGGILQLIYRELVVFMVLYYALAVSYRFIMNKNQQIVFEYLALYSRKFQDTVPLAFVLSFYIGVVIKRWWEIFLHIPWPDRAATFINAYIVGQDPKRRMIRRTLVRYLNLSSVLTFQAISVPVKKRFPTSLHLVDAGLMTEDEKELLESTPSPHGTYFQPIVWFTNILMEAYKDKLITSSYYLERILVEAGDFRGLCGMLLSYDWISVPIVYTQVRLI